MKIQSVMRLCLAKPRAVELRKAKAVRLAQTTVGLRSAVLGLGVQPLYYLGIERCIVPFCGCHGVHAIVYWDNEGGGSTAMLWG